MPSPAPETDTDTETEMVVLFTDVVDSTQVHVAVGDEAARALWAEHDRAARDLLRRWRGREVGRSDGFLVLFASGDDALGFALGYQRALAALRVPFKARVGAHRGAVALRHNSADDIAAGAVPLEVDGLTLPAAARVMAAAQGGQVLFSAAAAASLGTAALAGLQARSHGHWRLKGLDEPMELVEIGAADAAFAPPPDSAKAYRVVQRDGLWSPVASLPHNLGREPDPFVGRDEALRALAQAIDGGARFVTLLGMGGIGKTRLAQRYARGWLGSHPGGAWFCDLSAARGLDGIVLAVAQALDLPLGRGDPVQQLGQALASRGDCLLVLDNFEQVARHAAATLGAWLQAAPAARFIVTSRELLGLPGEQVQVLSPLGAAEGEQLFRQRMQAAGIDEGGLAEADAAALAPLVEMLDRLPLAIELAAARARVMPPADQLRRIGERFRLLSSRGARHDRQATLRATLDWSWDLLIAPEQSALAQLSVFEGGFTLAAAEAVLAVDPDAPWLADLLQSLVEKSLVRRMHARRFDLLRTVQDYATERLGTEQPAAFARHWRHFAGLTEAQAVAERCAEIDNLAAACRRAAAVAEGDATAAAAAVGALVNTWAALRLVGPFRAAGELAAPLAQRGDLGAGRRAQLQRVLGGMASLLGQGDDASRHYRAGLQLAREAGERALQAQLLALLADIDVQRGQFAAAAAALDEALPLAQGHAAATITALNTQGNLAQAQGDLALAQQKFALALATADSLGDRRWVGGLHGSLGTVALMDGRAGEARAHLEKGLRIAAEVGDRQWAGSAHCNLGLLLHDLGEHEAARHELGAALRLARDMGHRRLEATTLCNLGLVQQALGEAEAALRSLQDAVQLAQALQSPRAEGQFRGYLGELLARLQRADAARDCFARAEALLSASTDLPAMVVLACQQAVGAAQGGDSTGARQQLARAEALAAKLKVQPESEAGKALARARGEVASVG